MYRSRTALVLTPSSPVPRPPLVPRSLLLFSQHRAWWRCMLCRVCEVAPSVWTYAASGDRRYKKKRKDHPRLYRRHRSHQALRTVPARYSRVQYIHVTTHQPPTQTPRTRPTTPRPKSVRPMTYQLSSPLKRLAGQAGNVGRVPVTAQSSVLRGLIRKAR